MADATDADVCPICLGYLACQTMRGQSDIEADYHEAAAAASNAGAYVKTNCNHLFHSKCLLDYAMACAATNANLLCPICRETLAACRPRSQHEGPQNANGAPQFTISPIFYYQPNWRLAVYQMCSFTLAIGTCIVVYFTTR